MRSKEKKSEIILLTFINGFLIYSTAVGINTVSNGSKSTGKDSLRECANIGQFIIGKPWWEPSELVDTIRKQIVVINELKMGINDKHPKSNADSLNKIIADLRNSLNSCINEKNNKDDTIKILRKQSGFDTGEQISSELKDCKIEKSKLEKLNNGLKLEIDKKDLLLKEKDLLLLECNKKLKKLTKP